MGHEGGGRAPKADPPPKAVKVNKDAKEKKASKRVNKGAKEKKASKGKAGAAHAITLPWTSAGRGSLPEPQCNQQ